jgi:hypothetical protein
MSEQNQPKPRVAQHFKGLSTCEINVNSQVVQLFTTNTVLEAGKTEEGAQASPLSLDQSASPVSGQVTLPSPLIFREALRALLNVGDITGKYQTDVKETFEAYGIWRKALDPSLTPIALKKSFSAFLAQHDPEAWFGLAPVVTLKQAGEAYELSFEQLDPTGRVYGCLRVKNGLKTAENIKLGSASFSGEKALYDSLNQINQASPLVLDLNANPEAVHADYVGDFSSYAYAPQPWTRALGQLLSASTLKTRHIELTRMDLYNILRHLRLNADIPGESKSIRFELVPGKAAALNLEPWSFHLKSEASVYQGQRAELIGIWDRRDLFLLEHLLPFVQRVSVNILGEAQPCFWSLDCGYYVFTLGIMGFRPSNWSRGILLDIELPRRLTVQDQTDTLVLSHVQQHNRSKAELLALTQLPEEELTVALRRNIQLGKLQAVFGGKEVAYTARDLWPCLDWQGNTYKNESEATAYRLQEQGFVEYRVSTMGTGESEVIGTVKERIERNQQMATYQPQYQLTREGAMRKISCDCAWMKDREKQKLGPCAHLQALFLSYALDEQKRRIERERHPELVEFETKRYVRRKAQKEWSFEVSLKKTRLEEKSTIQVLNAKEAPENRSHFLVFPDVKTARKAYFNRIADLERLGYMDASK